MPENSKNPFNFHDPAFTQISESHCGPAVIQMLLANQGVQVKQEDIAEQGGAVHTIETHGMTVDQLALAVQQLAPETQFWYKDFASLDDLIELVETHRLPVGVEWQGLFEDEDDEDEDDDEDTEEEDYEDDPPGETEDTDYGHYSIVTHVDRENEQLIIADPYKDYIDRDRIFTFAQFEVRWWDTNEITNPRTGRTKIVEDYHMLFVVTPKETTFPISLGLKRAIVKRINT